MDELLEVAIKEMQELRQPYLGTHHLFLSYLKMHKLDWINYDTFKTYVIEIIGSCYKSTDYVIYTPLVRKLVDNNKDINRLINEILFDDNSIVYNILLSKNINIEIIK